PAGAFADQNVPDVLAENCSCIFYTSPIHGGREPQLCKLKSRLSNIKKAHPEKQGGLFSVGGGGGT
ncbi:MAG: hypothetical protein ACRBBR_15675, partial [Cellvibrionaceae bacterium]